MDLALCIFEYYPYGGLQRDFLKVAKAALARGHQVTCYTMRFEGDVPTGLNLVLLPMVGSSNHARATNFSKELAEALKKHQHKAVLGFNRMAGLDFYFAGDACFLAQVQRKHPWAHKILPRYQQFIALERAVFSEESKTIIFLLDPAQGAVFESFYQTPLRRFCEVPPGVSAPEKIVSKEKARTELALPCFKVQGAKILLMVGDDLKRKGLDRNLHLLASLSVEEKEHTFLLVIGQQKLPFFKKMAKELGVEKQVIFLGAQENVYQWMQAADVLLHPAYQETAGMVIVEALVNGLPVIATDNCGYAFHIANSGAGELVSGVSFRQDDYIRVLHNVLEPKKLALFRKRALDYAHTCDLSSMADVILDEIESHV